ncbi:hypothetical protein [Spirochaeta isovalerica]|uniref:Uncharacterized protein n=1 Tax=Spirochaeta isovalerica TaxID=150 RepID=A0A841RC17_9SPIO|nr:hypothetical protein [Spirochaeta isovalerica]MBB6481525.1 hypothetical protein [Spirochaeta isovalerica]
MAVLDFIIYYIVPLASLSLPVFAIIEIRNLVRTNTITTVLNLENEFNTRKTQLNSVSREILLNKEELNNNPDLREALRGDLKAAKENYLNALDRFCFCIDKTYIREKEWKTEYFDLIENVVDRNKDEFKGISKYRNIQRLHKRWI